MSGVSRLRLARRGGGTNPMQHAELREGRANSAKDCAEPLKMPKKKGAWEKFPNTGAPEGSESPHRGEPIAPGNRSPGMR